jgi:hypothetical protein
MNKNEEYLLSKNDIIEKDELDEYLLLTTDTTENVKKFQVNKELEKDVSSYYLKKEILTHIKENYISYYYNDKEEIPKNCGFLYFEDNFNQEIKKNVLPNKIIELVFSNSYNKKIKKNVLPDGLKKIQFGYNFNQEIEENVLPKNLSFLKFDFKFNQEIKENILPLSLTNLVFGFKFNQEIKENVLPSSLTKLVLGNDFNKEIRESMLPEKLSILQLSFKFNQDIKENVLPLSLTDLIFGYDFNKEIRENVLPLKLEKLTLGYSFNKKITLPISLKELEFASNCPIKNNIPHSVETLYIHFIKNSTNNDELINIPSTVKKIRYMDTTLSYPSRDIKKNSKLPFGCIVENMGDKSVCNIDRVTNFSSYYNFYC